MYGYHEQFRGFRSGPLNHLSLLSVASKLVSSVIATRLGNHFIDVGLDEQCGGVFGKGCIDGTYNVKQALHTLSQHGADSYVIFADLVKAYDTVDRELLWKIMARYGCPEELIFVLRKLYTNITVQLKGFGKGFTIPSTVGVKQGDNLAPVLFIFFINAEPEWKEADIDVPWLSGYCSHEARQEKCHGHSALIGAKQDVFSFFLSYYVDDAAFILMNREDAVKAATLIVRHFRKFGLTIHVGNRVEGSPSKTEALYVPSMCRGIKRYEDIPAEEIADIELAGEDLCAKSKTLPRPWTFVGLAGSRSCRAWTSPDVLWRRLALRVCWRWWAAGLMMCSSPPGACGVIVALVLSTSHCNCCLDDLVLVVFDVERRTPQFAAKMVTHVATRRNDEALRSCSERQ